MPDPERRIVEFDGLNWLGKAVWLGGQVTHAVAWLLEAAVERAGEIVGDAERAFREALDDSVEDAHILEERPRESSGHRGDPPPA